MPFSLYLLAMLHVKLGNLDKAESFANQLLKEGESTFYVLVGHGILADVNLYRRQFDKALEHTQIASEMDPQSPWVNIGLAVIYAAQGKRDKSLEKFKEVLAAKMLDEYIYQKTIELFALLDDRNEVYHWVKDGLNERPFIWHALEYNPILETFRREAEFQKLLAEAKEKILNSE